MKTTPDKTILLSAGGTGGHLFPAEALAQELLSRGRSVVIVTDKRGNAFKSLGDKVPVYTVRAATLKAGVVSKIKAVINIVTGIVQSARLLMKHKPAVIVGFGGYPSFPAAFAGLLLGVPVILHEQNAILGKANAVLARGAKYIATSLPGTRGFSDKEILRTVLTGNPVRAEIVAVRDIPYAPPADEFRILVTGGSQAASIFSAVVPDAVAKLPDALKKRLNIVHQAREADIASATEKYARAGVRAEIKAFFGDMPKRLAACHVLIGRSGASTVAEMAAVGRPSIFIPFPHKDLQQKFNAEELALAGGAWIVMQDEFNADILARKLEEMIENPAILAKAAAAAKSCGNTDAAKKLADLVEKNA